MQHFSVKQSNVNLFNWSSMKLASREDGRHKNKPLTPRRNLVLRKVTYKAAKQ